MNYLIAAIALVVVAGLIQPAQAHKYDRNETPETPVMELYGTFVAMNGDPAYCKYQSILTGHWYSWDEKPMIQEFGECPMYLYEENFTLPRKP